MLEQVQPVRTEVGPGSRIAIWTVMRTGVRTGKDLCWNGRWAVFGKGLNWFLVWCLGWGMD